MFQLIPPPCPFLSSAPRRDPRTEPARPCSPPAPTLSFLSPHSRNASSFHHSHLRLDELHLSGSHFYNTSWERALRDGGRSPGLGQGPSASSARSCCLWRIAWHTAGDQYSGWKKSTSLALVRLFLSRGYNLSIRRLVPAWGEAGAWRRGARWQSHQQRWQGEGCNRPRPDTAGQSVRKSAHPTHGGTLFIVVSLPKQRVCNPGNTPWGLGWHPGNVRQ